jgi:hypothetical protein
MRAVASDDDEVHSVRQEARPLPKAFTAEPLDAVAANRTPDPARHDQPEPRDPLDVSLGGDEQREVRRPYATAIALRSDELPVPPKPAVAPEIERHYFL